MALFRQGHPSFIGDLYNACDWCDESWTLENAPYLVEEAERVLKALQSQLST